LNLAVRSALADGDDYPFYTELMRCCCIFQKGLSCVLLSL